MTGLSPVSYTHLSNAEFVASFSQERNRSFNTAVGVTTVSDRNTISVCVYGAQSVTAVSYTHLNEATDILTFSPNGDYVRVNPKPDHPIGCLLYTSAVHGTD